jgi:diguanylate cyclase (GGDEF)-like protein
MDRGLYGVLRKMHDQVLSRGNAATEDGPITRRELESHLYRTVTQAKRDDSTHVIYLLDMDHFSVINNTCGRKAGDKLLAGIGRLLRKTLGSTGLVAKLEDDKFAVLLENTSLDQGFELADKHRTALEKFKITWQGNRLQTGASIGLAQIASTTETAAVALAAAAAARAKSKAGGGNRIEVFRAHNDEPDTEASAWIAHIDKVLSEDRLELRCQKIAPVNDDSAKPH